MLGGDGDDGGGGGDGGHCHESWHRKARPTNGEAIASMLDLKAREHEESDDLFSPLRNLSLSRSKLVHSYTQGIRMIWA